MVRAFVVVLCVALLGLISSSVSADSNKDVYAGVRKIVLFGNDIGYRAGWCTAVSRLASAASEIEDESSRDTLLAYLTDEVAEEGFDSNSDFQESCKKALGQHKVFPQLIEKQLSGS